LVSPNPVGRNLAACDLLFLLIQVCTPFGTRRTKRSGSCLQFVEYRWWFPAYHGDPALIVRLGGLCRLPIVVLVNLIAFGSDTSGFFLLVMKFRFCHGAMVAELQGR